MDAQTLAVLRARVVALLPYRRNPRPVVPASFPTYVETELQRLGVTTVNILQVLQDFDDRLAATGH